jgi:hypothetical protein
MVCEAAIALFHGGGSPVLLSFPASAHDDTVNSEGHTGELSVKTAAEQSTVDHGYRCQLYLGYSFRVNTLKPGYWFELTRERSLEVIMTNAGGSAAVQPAE